VGTGFVDWVRNLLLGKKFVVCIFEDRRASALENRSRVAAIFFLKEIYRNLCGGILNSSPGILLEGCLGSD
jgi:hypothetical protein